MRNEKDIQESIRDRLHMMGWRTKKIHGNRFQVGLPDLYAYHKVYGQRWIEIKDPKGDLRFEQVKIIREFGQHGVGVWILEDIKDIVKLYKEPNSAEYMLNKRLDKKRYR